MGRLQLRSVPMGKWLWIVWELMTFIPFAIAYKRKCANFALIDLLGFSLSWTMIGWVVAMAWAIWGEVRSAGVFKTNSWLVLKPSLHS